MTISELIEILEQIKEENGDLDVVIQNRRYIGIKREFDGFIDPVTHDFDDIKDKIENIDEVGVGREKELLVI